MKLKSILMMSLAGIAFTACSSDDVTTSEKLENGGQVAIRIALPTTSDTRAASDDGATLNDGDANEYAVKGAVIALYAVNAGDTVCVGSDSFTPEELKFTMNSDDKITSTSAIVKIPADAMKPSLALAIVNPGALANMPKKGDSYSAFRAVREAAEANGTGENADGSFMMTNSVYTDGATPTKIINLAAVDEKSISSNVNVTPEASTNIYVERVSGKATIAFGMSGESTYGTYDAATKTVTFTNGNMVKILGCGLTVTNKNFYPVKQVSLEGAQDWSTQTKYQMYARWNDYSEYRSFWGEDANYAKNAATPSTLTGTLKDMFNYLPFTSLNGKFNTTQYALENTFNVLNQDQNQTTAVIVAAQYILKGSTAGANVYTVKGVAYNYDNARKKIVEYLTAAGYTDESGNALTYDKLEIFASEKSTNNRIGYVYDHALNIKLAGTDVTVYKALKAVFNNVAANIKCYNEGYCYYALPIQHFGDNVKLYDGTSYYTYNGMSGINSADKLGRYGFLRNNWYQININSISGIGAPVINPNNPINPDPNYPDPTDPSDPDTPTTPTDPTDPDKPVTPDPTTPTTPTHDDVNSYYINAQIHILPWAVRTQSINF
jgi:hypothetical protein